MQAVMSEQTISTEKPLELNGHADWQIVSDAILRIGNIPSINELLHQALDLWIQQLSPDMRWKIAVDLYTSEEVSLGRAAEIGGLNYVVFMEKLRNEGIQFVTAQSTTESQKEMRKSLIHGGFNLPTP